jgi:hypothetical protein
MTNSPDKTQIRLMFSDTPIGKWAAPSISGGTAKWRCTMKRQRAREDFWLVLGLINLVAMVYPISCCLQANSMEDQLMAVFVLVGVGLLLAIVDTVSIAVAYSQ